MSSIKEVIIIIIYDIKRFRIPQHIEAIINIVAI